jgi:prepilin-type N-terminal cleavage/methylation domain-containing protein
MKTRHNRRWETPLAPSLRKSPRRRPAHAGFTLIEVLAAVFLTAIVMAVAIAFQVQLGDATTRARELIRTQRRAVTILDRIARDLQGAYLLVKPGPVDPLDHPWVFLGEKLSGSESADAVKFVTRNFRAHTVDGPTSDVAVLAYYLRKAPDEPGYQLMRWLSPRLPESLDREFPAEDNEDAMIVADGLDTFNLTFISEAGEELSEWDSSQLEQSGELPLAVRIEIAMLPPNMQARSDEPDEVDFAEDEEDDGEREFVFERLVVLPMRPVSFEILEKLATSAEKQFAAYLPEGLVDDAGETADDDDDDDKDEGCQRGTISACVSNNSALLEQYNFEAQQVFDALGVSGGECVDDLLDNPIVASYCL